MSSRYENDLVVLAAAILTAVMCPDVVWAIGQTGYVETSPQQDGFVLAQKDNVAVLYVDVQDYTGVVRAVKDLQADIARVTSLPPEVVHNEDALQKNVVIIGTIGKSPIVDKLIDNKKIDVTQIKGKWESFLIQVLPEPLPGVASALVIVGSDKRGTIYGIYDLSEQIGVSPWYWWADVPVKTSEALFVKPGKYLQGPPAVKYRGIFLNDE